MAVQKTRNYGVDLLKIFAMLMVTVFHVIGHGGVLGALGGRRISYEALNLMRIFTCCAVNCFAMASGYVQGDTRHRYRKLIPLHLRVLFYSVTITALMYLLSHGSMGERALIRAFFPVSSNTYWYYTAYFGLFFLIPFFNEILDRLDRGMLTRMMVTVLILFTAIPYVSRSAIFSLADGYSLLWICVMYLLGAYLKKMDVASRISRKTLWVLLTLSVVVAWLSRPVIDFVGILLSGSPGTNAGWLSYSYLSPATVLRAAALLLLFAKMDLKRETVKKWAVTLSSGSFSVYLIHDNPLLRERFISGRFGFLGDYPAVVTLLGVLGVSLGINALCYAVDAVRSWLFRVTKLSSCCESLWEKLANRLRKKIHP